MFRSLQEPTLKISREVRSLSTGGRSITSFRPAESQFFFKAGGCMDDRQPKKLIYKAACQGYAHVLAFELSPRFAANGEIFDTETFRRILEIPEIKGLKHSSLDRLLELDRLRLRDALRPEFRIYTGNDLGIDTIEYGSDYLLGLATFAPEKFAERDQLWQTGDSRYYALSDALQYLGNVAFREPVTAYKHSAAVFLHLTGRVPADLAHPGSPRRPSWEKEILKDCALRLGAEIKTVDSPMTLSSPRS